MIDYSIRLRTWRFSPRDSWVRGYSRVTNQTLSRGTKETKCPSNSYARRQNDCEQWLSPSPCLSVRMEQNDAHQTDFCGISYWMFLLKFVDTFWFWLKSDENKIHFNWRHTYVYDFSLKLYFIIDADCILCDIRAAGDKSFNIEHDGLQTSSIEV